MAKVKSPLFSVGASGKFANVLAFRETSHGAVATRYHFPGSVNSFVPSQAQLDNQAWYGAAVGAWRLLTQNEKDIFNGLGALKNLSGWNMFLAQYQESQSLTFGPIQVNNNARDIQQNSPAGILLDGHDDDGSRVGGGVFGLAVSWASVNIDPDSTIDEVKIEFFMKWRAAGISINTRLVGIAHDNLPEFSPTIQMPGLSTTGANVIRTYGDADYADEQWLELDVDVAIIKEIMDRPGWVSGNAIGVYLGPMPQPIIERWQFQDFSRQPQFAPRLTIKYTPP